jgi:hypothetical protein
VVGVSSAFEGGYDEQQGDDTDSVCLGVGVPVRQYCYYSAPNSGDYSSTKTDIALNGMPLPNISASLVPELQGALAKCQWWKDER